MSMKGNDKKPKVENARKRRNCLGCLGRGGIILASLLVVALAAGAIYQAAASASDLKKYPATGKLYDIGDYSLRLTCTGEGSPTVVLEAGSGTPGLTWAPVQREIEKSTRVCSYDRAGYGYSESAPGPLPPQQVASDLLALLEKAGVLGPISWSVIQRAASTYAPLPASTPPRWSAWCWWTLRMKART